MDHYRSDSEVWLIFYRKESGKPRISYVDSVKEALCFGWIDSTVKTVDDERFAQKFSPRNPKSSYSQTNKERLKLLIGEGLVMEDVLARMGDIDPASFTFPADIMAALRANAQAWENFQRFSPPYQRIRLAYIDDARDRPGDFEKRLDNFLRNTEMGKQFGYGIEEFYT
jgi:uncharacterized protein YdeI (YjbR/CyaY-like superfamily)